MVNGDAFVDYRSPSISFFKKTDINNSISNISFKNYSPEISLFCVFISDVYSSFSALKAIL